MFSIQQKGHECVLWYPTCIAFNKGVIALSIAILLNLLDVGSPVYFSVCSGRQSSGQ